MAVLASRSWTGFVVKNSYVASQEFARRKRAGRRRRSGWSASLQSQWRDPLPPEGPEWQDAKPVA
ncbi:FixH family protein [Mesorhizobium sp. M1227]|uniref:FixH family protein n=1 Tax=Mesorhizobium sp. M1227 TaxID=2957071 RepID=UPI003336E3F3